MLRRPSPPGPQRISPIVDNLGATPRGEPGEPNNSSHPRPMPVQNDVAGAFGMLRYCVSPGGRVHSLWITPLATQIRRRETCWSKLPLLFSACAPARRSVRMPCVAGPVPGPTQPPGLQAGRLPSPGTASVPETARVGGQKQTPGSGPSVLDGRRVRRQRGTLAARGLGPLPGRRRNDRRCAVHLRPEGSTKDMRAPGEGTHGPCPFLEIATVGEPTGGRRRRPDEVSAKYLRNGRIGILKFGDRPDARRRNPEATRDRRLSAAR